MFKRENVYNLSTLLAKWMTEHQSVKNRVSVDYNIKDPQNITKLSESQILKVFHEVLSGLNNEKIFLNDLNSSMVRTLAELYSQEGAQKLIMADLVHFLDLTSKLLFIFSENQEEFYHLFTSNKELARQCCPFANIESKISQCIHFLVLRELIILKSAKVDEKVIESLIKSAIRFKRLDFKCFEEYWNDSICFSFYQYFVEGASPRLKVLYFLLLSYVLKLSQHEVPFLLKHLYQINIDTKEYEAFISDCEKILSEEVFFATGDYLQHTFLQTANPSDTLEQVQLSPEVQGDKKLNCGEEKKVDGDSLVLSQLFLQQCQRLLKAYHIADFITINGETGCGKSTVVGFLSEMKSKAARMIRVYVDETTDMSSLIGNYTCSEKIGEFEWKNGPLINAMVTGSWLVLENFQEANAELINSLINIVRNRYLRAETYGGFVKPELGFKIIAVANFHLSSKANPNAKDSELILKEQTFFVDLSASIEVWASSAKELSLQVFRGLNSNPDNMVVYELISRLVGIFYWVRQNRSVLPAAYKHLNLDFRQLKSLVRRFSHRIAVVYGNGGIRENGYLTEEFRKSLILEMVDVLFGKYKDPVEPFPELWEKIFAAFEIIAKEGMQYIYETQVRVEKGSKTITVGRLGDVKLDEFSKGAESTDFSVSKTHIVYNSYSNKIIERLTTCLIFNESCLLVGDTGCGKTTISQHVAGVFGKKLYVYNLNQGSDTIDLVGGFKPIDLGMLLKRLLVKFVKNLLRVVNEKSNEKFMESLRNLYAKKSYNTLMKCMLESFSLIREKIAKMEDSANKQQIGKKWDRLEARISNVYQNKEKFDSNLAFQFLQGNLVKALRNGDWILIDEINLANNEVLQKLLPIIEGQSLLMYEKGDIKEIKRHPDFRLIGCMNPGSDIGKKELPTNVRSKFTELFIPDLEERSELHKITERTLEGTVSGDIVERLVHIYMWLREKSKKFEIEDGYNKRPHFSLRNLSRCLRYIKYAIRDYGLERSIFEGVNIGFGSILKASSKALVEKEIDSQFGINQAKYLKLVRQFNRTIPNHHIYFGFKIKVGPIPPKKIEECDFEVTPTFENYLTQLLSVISSTDHPILLEGPTSSGKTSMINFLAKISGYKCVRINNHNHTEIEEYIGTYLPDSRGKLVFQEGVLVEALRNGYWIILDELNLARSEILESLNRLLDDNKELFVPELQTHIKPHENFRLFATQNPTHYSGRKELSKAFKNRFIQIYFDDISEEDLEKIINKRCKIAPSYSKKLIKSMKDLQLQRQTNKFFQAKESAITVRDLIKWAKRPHASQDELAMEGYCLLAERLRSEAEREEVRKILEKNFKCKLEPDAFYMKFTDQAEFLNSRRKLEETLSSRKDSKHGIKSIQWNLSFRRMTSLVLKCIQNKEPVLLIGETGCGKTTLCQLLAILYEIGFYSINCHHYTESIDFLGSLRPVRNRDEISKSIAGLEKQIEELQMEYPQVSTILEALRVPDSNNEKGIKKISTIMDKLQKETSLYKLAELLIINLTRDDSLFEWQDGPLIEAMKKGGIFLIDEISLADDSVLERLNSVLEPERALTLSEKPNNTEEIVAVDKFFILATMNPGGDFGKRELSPALRNRFTEIWVEPITAEKYLRIDYEQVLNAVQSTGTSYQILSNFQNECFKMIYETLYSNNQIQFLFATEDKSSQREEILAELAWCIYRFLYFFNSEFCSNYLSDKKHLSLRDILTLVSFMENSHKYSVQSAFLGGLHVMIIDSIGMLFPWQSQRERAYLELTNYISESIKSTKLLGGENLLLRTKKEDDMTIESSVDKIRIGDFDLQVNLKRIENGKSVQVRKFAANNQNVQSNLQKIARALQIPKAVLLEGQPGVGKSSLIEYLAYKTGNKLLRINLSEQTDLIDLLGCDVPHHQQKDSQNKTTFRWADGLLLQAMKKGHWLMLEELNLANQTVLEGLNAILDHRGSVFIPELGREFSKNPKFRIFASQNPIQQGGGRKGLPASFLNRFTKVYIEEPTSADQLQIILELYSNIDSSFLTNLVEFNEGIASLKDLLLYNLRGNLRDLLRFCEIFLANDNNTQFAFEIVYLNRLPLNSQVQALVQYFEQKFQIKYKEEMYLQTPVIKLFREKIEIETSYWDGKSEASDKVVHKIARDPALAHSIKDSEELLLLNKDLMQIKHISKVLTQPWPILITGPRGSGRASTVKLLTKLVGKKLARIQLNSSTDSTDLIGNYNQNDVKRQILSFITELENWVESLLKSIVLTAENKIAASDLMALGQLLQKFLHTCAKVQRVSIRAEENIDYRKELVPISQILDVLAANKGQIGEIKEIDAELEAFREQISKLSTGLNQQIIFFSWFDSELIKAARNGDWVLLEDVEKCNSAILERINPLLEPGGVLYITEHALSDSKSLKIVPHPGFKIFLTLDETQKISDPIRNRCIELYLRGASSNLAVKHKQGLMTHSLEKKLDDALNQAYIGDLKKLVRDQGVTHSAIENLLIGIDSDFYNELGSNSSGAFATKRIGLFATFLKRFLQIQKEQSDIFNALQQSSSQVYGKHLSNRTLSSLNSLWNVHLNEKNIETRLWVTAGVNQGIFFENALVKNFNYSGKLSNFEKLFLMEKFGIENEFWSRRSTAFILGETYQNVKLPQVLQYIQILYCYSLLQNLKALIDDQLNTGKLTDTEYRTITAFLEKLSGRITSLQKLESIAEKTFLLAASICSYLVQNTRKNLRNLDPLFVLLDKKLSKHTLQNQLMESHSDKPLASTLWLRSRFRQTMPKHVEIYEAVRLLLYLLSEPESSFYLQYRGASKEVLEQKMKLNDLLFSDEQFTKRSFNLFGLVLNKFCKLPRSQATALLPSLKLLVEGYFKELQEKYPIHVQLRVSRELHIIDENENQPIKTVQIYENEAFVKAALKRELRENPSFKDSNLVIFIEYLRLETFSIVCNLLMKEMIAALAEGNNTVDVKKVWRAHLKRLYEPELFDLGLSEGFKLFLCYLMNAESVIFEEIIELYVRLEIDLISINRKMEVLGLTPYNIATKCHQILTQSTIKNTYLNIYLKQAVYDSLAESLRLEFAVGETRMSTEVKFVMLWISKCLFDSQSTASEIASFLKAGDEVTQETLDRLVSLVDSELMGVDDRNVSLRKALQTFKELLVTEIANGFTQASIRYKLAAFAWHMFDFSSNPDSVFAFFKEQLSADLISFQLENLTERVNSSKVVNNLVFCSDNDSLGENMRLVGTTDRLKLKKENKESDIIVRTSNGENYLETYSEFHRRATPRIKEITKMLAEPTKPENFAAFVVNWVDSAYQEYFTSFRDILIPLMFAGLNLIELHAENSRTKAAESTNNVSYVMKNSELLLLTQRSLNLSAESELEKDVVDKLNSLANVTTGYSAFRDLSWENKFSIPFFVILFERFHSHFRPKEEEEDEDDDDSKPKNLLQFDRSVQYLKLQNQISNMIIDEYTKKAVEFHKQQEELEIEERFHNRENKVGLEELASKQSIKDILDSIQGVEATTQDMKPRKKLTYDKMFLDIISNLILKTPSKSHNHFSNILSLVLDVSNKKAGFQKELITGRINLGMSIRALLGHILSGRTKEIDSEFYDNENLPEMSLLFFVLERILKRCKVLLENDMFYSNPNLQNIAVSVDYLEGLPLHFTSIPRVLPVLSHLLLKIEEWNAYVPAEFRMTEQYEELRVLVIRWRKCERESWKLLLKESEKKIQCKEAGLLTRIIAFLLEGKIPEKVFEISEEFIRRANFATFEIRLKIIEYIVKILQTTASKEDASKFDKKKVLILKSVYDFYSLFFDFWTKKKQETQQQMEKQVKEFITLNRWDSHNHHTLKITVEKYHRKLNTIAKRYEEILEEPIENTVFKPFRANYLTESTSHFVATYTLDFKAINRQEFDPRSFKPITIPSIHQYLIFPKGQETQTIIFKNWIKAVFPLSESKIKALVPQHLRHEFEANKMTEGSLATTEVTHGDQDIEQENGGICSLKEYLKENINAFFRRLENLREEKTAKNTKMKAFTDLLKFIKELGINETSFKDRFDLEQMQEEGSVAEIREYIVNLFAQESKELTTRLTQSSDKIFKYTRKSKDYQNIIRSNKSFCPEVSMEDLRRSHGFINSLWDYNCTMRASLTLMLEKANAFSTIKKQVLYIEDALKHKEDRFVWVNDKLKKLLQICVNEKDDLLLELDQFDHAIMKLKMIISEQLKGKLQELRLSAKELHKLLEPIMPLAIVSISDLGKLKQGLVNLREVFVIVDKLLLREDAGDVFLLGLLDKLSSQVKQESAAKAYEMDAVMNSSQGMVTELTDNKPFEEAIKQVSLYLQNMAKQQNKYAKVIDALLGDENAEPLAQNDPRKTFSKNEERQWGNISEVLRTLLENLKIEQIFPNTSFSFGGSTKDLLLQLSASIKIAGLIVSSGSIYCFQTQKTLDKFNYLVSTVVYNLTYKGFCSPSDQGEGEDDGGKGDFRAAEGTGIGEGQGMENVSKEIEFEEQVLGERQDQEKVQPQDQRKIKEEKEAVNMENEFEGENYEKDKEEENQMDEEDNNPDDFEDEFSSVDNEFDYKMWHDEKKQEGEEEEDKEDGAGNDDQDLSMSEEEKLEFHDEEEKGETEARAKEKKHKEKSEKRQAKDYDAFKPDEEEKDDKENINEQKPEDNVEEEKDAQEEYRKGQKDEKEEQKEPNEEQKDLDVPDDGDEKVSFESENEAELEKDENKSAKLNEEEEGAEDMQEEPQKEPDAKQKDEATKDQEMEIENEGAKKDGEEIEEEEEKKENKEKDFSSKPQQKRNQNKKPEIGKEGFKNEVREDENAEEEKQEQNNGVNQQEQMQKEGKLFGQDAMQVEEKSNNSEDFLKKLIENLNSVAMSEEMKQNLDNFIKDLNIVRENLEEQDNSQPDKRTQGVLEDPKTAENMLFEAVQQNNQSDSFKNSLKTNAPTSTNPSMQMNSSSNKQEKDAGEFVSDMNPEMTTENENFDKPDAKKQMQEEKKQEAQPPNQIKESKSTDKASSQQSLPRETRSLVEKAQKEQIDRIMQENQRNEESKNDIAPSNRMEVETVKKLYQKQQEDLKNPGKIPVQASKTHQELKDQLEDLISQWKLDSLNQEEGLKVWNQLESSSRNQATHLCEELRAVLEPTKISGLKGDYKSGKRLNMKKIIPYIASNYRKDKIWLRRSDPNKRNFQIMLAIDDSLSMSEQNVGFLALESLTMMALAMSRLEIGQLAISVIKQSLQLLHPFDKPLTSNEGPYILSQFKFQYFDENSSDLSMMNFLRQGIDLFKEWKERDMTAEQICFIISDGRLNKNLLRPLVREAEENKQLYVFIILDKKEAKDSIMNIRSTKIEYVDGKANVTMTNYLDDFPFQFYIIVHDLSTLPKVLVDILRQYLESMK